MAYLHGGHFGLLPSWIGADSFLCLQVLCTLVQVYVYAQVHADFHVQVVDCVFCVVSDLGYECPGAEGGGGGPGEEDGGRASLGGINV